MPALVGLDAGARGIADHMTREGDDLLVWFRSAGRMQTQEVQLYLARRVIAAGWNCDASDAAAIIRDAMLHVLTRRRPCAAKVLRMRKRDFLALRSRASAWLRAGILDANWRYGIAADLWEPPPP
ncbi:hypothetical protein LYSHEL_25500 [Lysobacter helvus]|uniref:Uncharacterized protein n=1 Tax=Lysobacter helvus TaxID=2675059 RepID=A0ABN6G3T4_9GAMM|nr:hypothetical protein LYSHEL_25500 [Lysobacter helvus]